MNNQQLHADNLFCWLPAGLLTWYGPEDQSFALITSWFALFQKKTPRVRAAWSPIGTQYPVSWPEDRDFVLNVPEDDCLQLVQELVNRGQIGFEVNSALKQGTVCGLRAKAPRLVDCPLQIECVNGRLVQSAFDADIVGEIVLIHRNGIHLDPKSSLELFTANPPRSNNLSGLH